ncbi:MAG: endonuclease/exonuclease/phosphatase family protein [Bacteroidales bacterium]|jgi:endonuclease/exonuclease/phosphatase family metal-dependent hydrolase
MNQSRIKYFLISSLLIHFSFFAENAYSYASAEDMTVDASFRVMCYNIHHCDPPYNTGEATDIDTIIGVIAKQNPDIVALQEVDVYTTRSGSNVHQAKVIADRLGMNYFFAPAINYQGGKYGVAILSKFPMSENNLLELPRPDVNGEKRVLARSKITLSDGTFIRFGCTHFDLKTDNKRAQVAKVNELALSESLPFIIAGDLNATEGSIVINTLDDVFTRSCTGCSPTSPARNPQNTIDYIAYRHPENNFSIVSHKTVNETFASDHRPIVAVIGYQKIITDPNGTQSPGIAPVKLIGRKLISEVPTSISIFNLLGVLLYQQSLNTTFDIPARIGKGIYLVKTSNGSNKIIL